MKIEDVELVYALGIGEKRFRVGAESAGFWTKEQLRNWVKSKDDVLLVAEENRQIVGYVLSQYHAPTRKATFENLYVFPKYRNLGIAKMLTLELIHQLKEKKAYVLLKSTSKLHLAESEVKIELQETEDLEQALIKKFQESNPSQYNSLISSLIKTLQIEKLEDETTLSFEDRLITETKKIIQQ